MPMYFIHKIVFDMQSYYWFVCTVNLETKTNVLRFLFECVQIDSGSFCFLLFLSNWYKEAQVPDSGTFLCY